MGDITTIYELQIHTGDTIKVVRKSHIVRVFKNEEEILVMGQSEWEELTR